MLATRAAKLSAKWHINLISRQYYTPNFGLIGKPTRE